MISYWLNSSSVKDRVYIPKYYNPGLDQELESLKETHDIVSLSTLVNEGVISVSTGHEIGKMAYGTGNVPFVRTSDLTNWETKTSPKQGVSESIYLEYRDSQDVQSGDILLVRDGTYLIGTNCIITELDKKILFQSHLLKIRVEKKKYLDPYLLFVLINSPVFQRQIRSVQFTADTIDTIGNRFYDLFLTIPKDIVFSNEICKKCCDTVKNRELGKAFIKNAPSLIEDVLSTNSLQPIKSFLASTWDNILENMSSDTVTSEFGHFETFWCSHRAIKNRIYLPKYYAPEVASELRSLSPTCSCRTVGELVEDGVLMISTGDEVGKMAYGTGSIPFIRTSDFSNWELKHDPKQGLSEDIYSKYAVKQDVKAGDILLVRDGTYLVGTSCIISEGEEKILYCGGLYKLRVLKKEFLDEWLLLGLVNSYIVKRQIRTKQFTRDVIDTLGKRIEEVVLPIPKSERVRKELSLQIQSIVHSRVQAKRQITQLSKSVC